MDNGERNYYMQRINAMQESINAMQRELQGLKSGLQQGQINMPNSQMPQQWQINMPYPQIPPQPLNNNGAVQKSGIKHGNLEHDLGRNVMGILASALIFISLFFFAAVPMPSVIKLIGMYLLSLAFFGTGVFEIHRKMNAFTLSIAGCGQGAIYVCIFLTYVHFHYGPVWLMYSLIIIWAVLFSFFEKNRSWIFQVIGQTGTAVAVIYGAAGLVSGDHDVMIMNLIFTTVFFILTSLFYMAVQEPDRPVIMYILSGLDQISLFAVLYKMSSVFASETAHMYIWLVVILIESYILAMQLIYLRGIRRNAKKRTSYSMLYAVYILMQVCFSVYMVPLLAFRTVGHTVRFMAVCSIAVYALIWAAEEWRSRNDAKNSVTNAVRCTVLPAIALMVWIQLYFLPLRPEYIIKGIIILLLCLSGGLRKDTVCRIISLCMLFTYFFIPQSPELPMFAIAYIIAVIMTLQLILQEETYSPWYKCALYVCVLVLMARTASYIGKDIFDIEHIDILTFYIIAAASCAMMKFGCRKEKVTLAVTGSLHVVMMLAGVFGILQEKQPLWMHIVSILIILALYCVNIDTMFRKYGKNAWNSAYTGMKLTLFVAAALVSFSVEGYWISSAFILIAISCILIGFAADYKGFRMYGLVLSLLGVAKLIIFDIRYNSFLTRAVSFLLCGLLCFAISMIYNYMNGRVTGGRKNDHM